MSEGMSEGYYWVKQEDYCDWEPVYFDGRNFIWPEVCHGQEDLVLHPADIYKFNATMLIEPKDA